MFNIRFFLSNTMTCLNEMINFYTKKATNGLAIVRKSIRLNLIEKKLSLRKLL